jgi:hypothetical protein
MRLLPFLRRAGERPALKKTKTSAPESEGFMASCGAVNGTSPPKGFSPVFLRSRIYSFQRGPPIINSLHYYSSLRAFVNDYRRGKAVI